MQERRRYGTRREWKNVKDFQDMASGASDIYLPRTHVPDSTPTLCSIQLRLGHSYPQDQFLYPLRRRGGRTSIAVCVYKTGISLGPHLDPRPYLVKSQVRQSRVNGPVEFPTSHQSMFSFSSNEMRRGCGRSCSIARCGTRIEDLGSDQD